MDESQSRSLVPEKLLKTRDLELLIFEAEKLLKRRDLELPIFDGSLSSTPWDTPARFYSCSSPWPSVFFFVGVLDSWTLKPCCSFLLFLRCALGNHDLLQESAISVEKCDFSAASRLFSGVKNHEWYFFCWIKIGTVSDTTLNIQTDPLKLVGAFATLKGVTFVCRP